MSEHYMIHENDLHTFANSDFKDGRKALVATILADNPTIADVQADALVDAAEVIKLRMDKKLAKIAEMEQRPGMSGYVANWLKSGHRAVLALTIEDIMYRWLMARSEAVRAQ